MTPVQFLEQAEKHRAELVRLAEAITKDYSSAEDVVQEAILYSYGKKHLYDAEKASLLTWLTRCVMQRAVNAKNHNDRLYPPKFKPQFNDYLPYNPQDAGMKAVYDAGLPQVRLVEPDPHRRRAMPKEQPDVEPSYTIPYDDILDVQKALSLLSVELRDVAVAVFMEGKSHAEYAAKAHITEKTVQRRLRQAREELQNILK